MASRGFIGRSKNFTGCAGAFILNFLVGVPTCNNEMKDWQTYDPAELIALVMEHSPERAWLAEALLFCRRARQTSERVEFQSNGEFSREVVIEDASGGRLVFGIMTDGRVSSVVFDSRVAA